MKSCIAIIMIALTSVMQFHHHDLDGNTFICLTESIEIAFTSSELTISHCHHHDASTNSCDNDCDDNDDCHDCGLRIAPYEDVRNECLLIASPTATAYHHTVIAATYNNITKFSLSDDVAEKPRHTEKLNKLNTYSYAFGLRGPPSRSVS